MRHGYAHGTFCQFMMGKLGGCHLAGRFQATATPSGLSRKEKRQLRRQLAKDAKILSKMVKMDEAQRPVEGRATRSEKSGLVTTFVPYVKGQRVSSQRCGVMVHQKRHSIFGYSLKTTREFKKGDVITQYEGTYVTQKEIDAMPATAQSHIASFKGQGGGIDGFKTPVDYRGAGAFANHSTNPNARLERMVQGIFLVARRQIKNGGFVMVNYGERFLASVRGRAHLHQVTASTNFLDSVGEV